ncbi:hypothetical protein M514_08512 [Trichuris suis]|uniref:Uncharacterized protein n=1 Tax=Trichuris suis TaxID=68888 RepID=A0A085NDV9_9BILA|nr:hypothetical protein M513_08512 [Trichuris suis]KFD67655.1 hypothetical protein M514_08512 [Trichuris suis]
MMGRQSEGAKGNGPQQWLEQKAAESDGAPTFWNGRTGDEHPSQPHEIGESTLDDHKELCQGRLELNYWNQVLRESRKP